MATASTDDLRNVPLFAELNNRQLRKLARLFRERMVVSGTAVVREGEMSGVGFFVIGDGEAAVSKGGSDLATLGPGDHFGELALVSGRERAATVTARTDLRLFEIPFWDFREFAHANADVTWTLLQHVVDLIPPGDDHSEAPSPM